MARKCYARLWIVYGYLWIVSDQKSCEMLKTVICEGPNHVLETIVAGNQKQWTKKYSAKAFP